MSVRVEKCFYDVEQSIDSSGNNTELEIPYLVFGVEEEDEALTAVRNSAAERVGSVKLESLEIAERINADVFKVRAIYERPDGSSGNDDSEPVFSFDTGGGSKHISQSLETEGRYPSSAPDFGGAIEVDGDGNVNGVDITMPVMHFSETHYLSPGKVSTSYKKRLAELTGTVNDANFKGYKAGEVLFLGATGTRRGNSSSDKWEISFRFSVSPNATNLKVGDIRVSKKNGWDYMWVRYVDDVSSNGAALIKKPSAAYVERVYERTDFGKLGIGR